MTRGESIGDRRPGRSTMRGDPRGEGVAAHIGQVFPQEVSRSTGLPGDRGTDNFHVMAFPIHLLVHLPATGFRRHRAIEGVEIGGRESKARIGGDGEPQRVGREATSGGLLRQPVPGRGSLVCGDRTAMVLNGRPFGWPLGTGTRLLICALLHGHQGAVAA